MCSKERATNLMPMSGRRVAVVLGIEVLFFDVQKDRE